MHTDPFVAGLDAIFSSRTDVTKTGISRAAGLDGSSIRKMLENPDASPKVRTADNIAAALGMSLDEIVELGKSSGRAVRRTITIAGRVGAGARVPVFDAYEKGDGPQVEAPPGLPGTGIVAVEVAGDSMAPVFEDGDILFYSRATPDGVPDDVVGHQCVAEDADGMGWVKQVKRGDEPGLFHLVSLNPGAQTMWNIPLKWAARVRLHWPAELVRRI